MSSASAQANPSDARAQKVASAALASTLVPPPHAVALFSVPASGGSPATSRLRTVLEAAWPGTGSCSSNRRTGRRPHSRGVTTSEGQSYALLRAVWMGDQATFDTVWALDGEPPRGSGARPSHHSGATAGLPTTTRRPMPTPTSRSRCSSRRGASMTRPCMRRALTVLKRTLAGRRDCNRRMNVLTAGKLGDPASDHRAGHQPLVLRSLRISDVRRRGPGSSVVPVSSTARPTRRRVQQCRARRGRRARRPAAELVRHLACHRSGRGRSRTIANADDYGYDAFRVHVAGGARRAVE